MLNEADEHLQLLEQLAPKRRFRPLLSHLPHFEIDWSISSEEMKEGKCLVKDMGCRGCPNLHLKQRVKAHYTTIAHLVSLRPPSYQSYPRNNNILHLGMRTKEGSRGGRSTSSSSPFNLRPTVVTTFSTPPPEQLQS